MVYEVSIIDKGSVVGVWDRYFVGAESGDVAARIALGQARKDWPGQSFRVGSTVEHGGKGIYKRANTASARQGRTLVKKAK